MTRCEKRREKKEINEGSCLPLVTAKIRNPNVSSPSPPSSFRFSFTNLSLLRRALHREEGGGGERETPEHQSRADILLLLQAGRS